MSKADGLPPKKALKDLELLANAGFTIPEQLVDLVQSESDKQDKIKQVWYCKKCQWTYKSNIIISGLECPKRHSMKIVRVYQLSQP